MARITATDAARTFSDVLSRVAAGEEIEVTRSGVPVAVITPPKTKLLTAARFRELLASAPPVDDEFAGDLREIRREAGTPESPWPS